VVCMSPRIDRPATAIVEVSFDGGISFTSSSLPFAYYEQPYIRASPDMIAVGVARTLSIMSLSGQGDGGFQGLVTPQCKVLFSTKGDGEVSVEARMGEAGELLCDMPPIGAGHVTVLVAINGQQYGDETGGASVLMYEQAKITGITPDCLNFEKGGTVTVMAENLLSSATIRIDTKEGAPSILSGALSGDGEQPASLTLSPSEIDLDAGAFTVNLPPTSSPGPLTLSISVDGQDYSGGQPQTLNMFGSLQPALEIPFAAQTGGLVNCLLEGALFPAAEMSVKVTRFRKALLSIICRGVHEQLPLVSRKLCQLDQRASPPDVRIHNYLSHADFLFSGFLYCAGGRGDGGSSEVRWGEGRRMLRSPPLRREDVSGYGNCAALVYSRRLYVGACGVPGICDASRGRKHVARGGPPSHGRDHHGSKFPRNRAVLREV
jgi:hypothetical protein